MIRKQSAHNLSWIAGLCGLYFTAALLAAAFAPATAFAQFDPAEGPVPRYEVFISADVAEPVLFRLSVPAGKYDEPFYFPGEFGPVARLDGLVTFLALDAEGGPLPLERSSRGYLILETGAPFFIEYELSLHPSTLKPSTWPNNHPYSLRWDDYAYITGDALLRSPFFHPGEAEIVLHLPASWTVHTADTAQREEGRRLQVDDVSFLTLLVGPGLDPTKGEGVRLLPVGSLPWPEEKLLDSLAAMMIPLRDRGLVEKETYDFVIARYPGALRFNPLISGRSVGPRTFLHWVGVGSLDWWLRHTAADIVRSAMATTLRLSSEAAWFAAGGADYVGLLILHEAGLLDTEEMYQSLRTMFATASRYAGGAWPSLLMAGVAEQTSHEAGRVLQFRAPIVSFLFDLELRERSGGEVTLLDWWSRLATSDQAQLFNEDLLPPVHTFGDMSDFFSERVFSPDRLAVDFEAVFERWIAASVP